MASRGSAEAEADEASALSADALLADLEPLEDLDDAEFGLPPVEHLPTLEEILAAGDDVDDDLDDVNGIEDDASSTATASTVPIGQQQLVTATLSAALHQLGSTNASDTLSVNSRGSDSRSRGSGAKGRRSTTAKDKGSIMRHVILKGVSAQMSSARERADAGLPTAMAAANYVAVGTSHGYVLVFDGLQTLKFSLGGPSYGRECGSVSCLAFDTAYPSLLDDGPSRLLVGFAKGHVLEYDVTNGKLLPKLEDAHPIGTAVIRARFTDDKSVALICDAGGSVFELALKRTLGVRGYNSRCIFSGSRGEVCTLEPLSLIGQATNHPLSDRIIVALATISKVIVLTIRPSMKVLFTHPLTGSSHTLPILSWQFVVIQTAHAHKVVDPVLAFGRQSTIYFFQLSENLSGRVMFVPLQKVELPYKLLNFGWLNTRCMALMDMSETFHLFDVRNQENLETIDLSDVQLYYGSSFFKGLATGGNVSAAMARAGEKATYESFLTFTNQLLLLGRKTFHVLMIRAWNERLDYLVEANNYLDCLSLGGDFYTDQGKALVGLRGPREKRKTVIAQKMLAILLRYLDICVNKNFPLEGNMTVLEEYFAEVVPPCVNLCIVLKKREILFENVWNAFQLDPFAKATYLECLESYILSDQLRNLPVNISQEFVNHYEVTQRYVALEACITHLNVTALDIHQVMNVCWQHNLYDSIIYIYNNGMLDYVSPAEELMSVLMSAMASAASINGYEDNGNVTKKMTADQIKLGNKLLVYVSCCLAGRAYPYGDVQADQVAQVKYDVYTCLTALHTKKAKEDEPAYPYLRALLTFDTQGLLNVISIAFEEPEFNTDLGKCQKQRLVDILLQIMVRDSGDSCYSPSQVAYLFTFLARQIAKGDHCLTVSRGLFEQVLDVLTDTTERAHHEERQQALLDMLNAGGMQYFDREHLIFRANKVGFHRILEMLYEKGGEHGKLLRCYIDDPLRTVQAFVFLQKVFLDSDDQDVQESKKGAVEKSVLAELDALLDMDGKKTAMIVYFHMYPYIPLVLDRLESKRAVLFTFLKHLLEYKESGSQPTTPVHKLNSSQDPLTLPDTYEKYIDLMCEHEPKFVAAYIRSKSNYRSDKVLKTCQKYKMTDAQAFLLEQQGHIEAAFKLLRTELDEKMQAVVSKSGQDEALLWTHVNAVVIHIVQLCQRSGSCLTSSVQREKLWFDLLDSLMIPQGKLKKGKLSKQDVQPFKDVVRHVVNSALGYVSLRTVIERILKDPVYQEDSFGDVQEFVVEMLEMYHYEKTLMKSTCQSVHADIHSQQKRLQKATTRGFSVHSLGCELCRQHLAKQCGRGIVFQCSHKFHMSCLQKAGCFEENAGGDMDWQCYQCMAYNASKLSKPNTTVVNHGEEDNSMDFPVPPEIVDEIINQHIVKAHEYMSRFKTVKSYLTLLDKEEDDDNNISSRQVKSDSIFESEDFPLKLSPQARREFF